MKIEKHKLFFHLPKSIRAVKWEILVFHSNLIILCQAEMIISISIKKYKTKIHSAHTNSILVSSSNIEIWLTLAQTLYVMKWDRPFSLNYIASFVLLTGHSLLAGLYQMRQQVTQSQCFQHLTSSSENVAWSTQLHTALGRSKGNPRHCNSCHWHHQLKERT